MPNRPTPNPQRSGTPAPGASVTKPEPDRTLAYSAVHDEQKPISTPAAPVAPKPVSKPAVTPAAKKEEKPVTASSTAARPVDGEMNWTAVVAFFLSAIGLLSPVGIWLGYRTRRIIDASKGQLGREFATAAIIIGWLWVAFVVLGLLAYLWILI